MGADQSKDSRDVPDGEEDDFVEIAVDRFGRLLEGGVGLEDVVEGVSSWFDLEDVSLLLFPEADQEHLPQRRRREKRMVQQLDTKESVWGCWFVIDSSWLLWWLEFTDGHGPPPGPINNHGLFKGFSVVDALFPSQFTPPDDVLVLRPDLKLKDDYRCVNGHVWYYLHSVYGGGPPLPRVELDIYSAAADTAMAEQRAKAALSGAGYSFVGALGASRMKRASADLAEAERDVATEKAKLVLASTLADSKRSAAAEQAKAMAAAQVSQSASLLQQGAQRRRLRAARVAARDAWAGVLLAAGLDACRGAIARQQLVFSADGSEGQQAGAATLMQGFVRFQLCLTRARLAMRALKAAAALVLQSAWRGRRAARQFAAAKARRAALLEEASAVAIQCAWRRRKTSQRLTAARLARQCALEEGAAIMLQAARRRQLARRRYAVLAAHRDHRAAIGIQSAFKARHGRLEFSRQKSAAIRVQALVRKRHRTTAWAASRLQAAWKCRTARLMVRAMYEKIDRPVVCHVYGASNVRAADLGGTSDPYCLVQVVSRKTGETLYSFETRVVSRSCSPKWDFECTFPGVNGLMDVLLTVCDRDRIGKDDFLGQASLPVSAAWHSAHGEHTTRELQLGDLRAMPHGKMLGDANQPGEGSVTVSLSVPAPLTMTRCGFLVRRGLVAPKRFSLFAGGSSQAPLPPKRQWWCLTGEELHCYDERTSSGGPLMVTRLADVNGVTDGDEADHDHHSAEAQAAAGAGMPPAQAAKAFTVHVVSLGRGGVAHTDLKFLAESQQDRDAWVYKLRHALVNRAWASPPPSPVRR